MRLVIVNACLMSLLILPTLVHAQDTKVKSYEDIQTSTAQLVKEWDQTRKEYKDKFKAQMGPIEQKIDELNNELVNGNPARRKEINAQIRGLKISRDGVREVFHELTATSVVKLSGVQKHFANAKDDTKD